MTFPCPRIRATDVSPSTRASLGGTAWNAIMGHGNSQIVGMVPSGSRLFKAVKILDLRVSTK